MANRSGETSAFRLKPAMRPLKVLVDTDSLEDEPVDDSALTLLNALLCTQSCDAYRWSDEGPPYIQNRRFGEHEAEVCDGWIRLHEHTHEAITFSYVEGDSYHEVSSVGIAHPLKWVGIDELHPSLGAFGPMESLHGAVLLGAVAQGLDADILITKRPSLLVGIPFLFRAVSFLSLDDSLPLIGLHLRMSGVFPINAAPGALLQTSKWSFYWISAKNFVPILHQLSQYPPESHRTESTRRELYAIIERMSWAIAARDSVLSCLCQPDSNEQEILVHITQFLIWILGCFDALALATIRLLDVPVKSHNASFRNSHFRDQLRKHEEYREIEILINEDGQFGNFLNLIAELRNSIHGEPLSSIGFKDNDKPEVNLITFPSHRRSKILAAMDRCGGRRHWGVDESFNTEGFCHPELLIQQVLITSAQYLNDIARLLIKYRTDLQNDGPLPGESAQNGRQWDLMSERVGVRFLRMLGLLRPS